MELERLDDYQSWGLETSSGWILLDPWLTGTCTLPGGKSVFERKHSQPPSRSPDELTSVRAIFLTAHFGDHFHAETLAYFPRETPVISTRWGVQQARKLGFTNCTELKAGERFPLGPDLEVRAIGPAFPYAHNSLGFYFVAEKYAGIYFETHGIRADVWDDEELRPEIVVTAVESVRLLGLPLTLGEKKLLQRLAASGLKRLIPSGTEPEKARGFLPALLQTSGSVRSFGQAISVAQPAIAFSPMGVGERLSLS